MGLAASQARFLGLTARKSNVEYQGQQVNQARTALSNEVMNLYRRYNSLDVPVPPSKTDFTKTVYTLDETSEKYQIGSFSKITTKPYEGYYKVVLETSEEIPMAYTKTFKDTVTRARMADDGSYSYVSFQIGTSEYTYDESEVDAYGKNVSNLEKITVTSMEDAKQYAGLSEIIEKNNYDITKNGNFYRFTRDGFVYYTPETNLPDFGEGEGQINTKDSDGNYIYNSNYLFDYQGAKKGTKKVDAIASLEQDKSGRLSTINVIKCDEDPDLEGNPYSITVSTSEDEIAYQDAMNKYSYEKDKYEKKVEIINKKTEAIQREDRALELKLNQLDTEQNALKTEMDSVSKVIEDTINSVFKTYNS